MSGYFQPTYYDCRDRFRALADEHGAQQAHHPIAARGVEGQELFLDTAYLGAEDARRILILLSGTHGVEGFAGSACQAQFLAETFSRDHVPPDGGVLFIHAVNPFGFAWVRRANENNVDMNRNFLDPHAPPVRRSEYVALHDIVNPPELSDETDAAFERAVMALVAEHGMAHVQAVLTNGQYECPEGIYYGGARPEASNDLLRRIFRERIAQADQALMIDFHTGLGDPGRYTILTEHERASRSYAFLTRTFPPDRVESTSDGESISAELAGEMGVGLAREVPDTWFISSACEFGTVPGIQVIQALRHENWLYHHGDRSTPQGQAILREMRDAFCPDADAWRADVLAGGREVIAAGWHGLFGAPLG